MIRNYIRDAFIADIEFDTKPKGGKLSKSNKKKTYNGGQNTYNVATDTIKIGNMDEWKNMVDEIKRNINDDIFCQNIEERPELPPSLIITGAETEQTKVRQYEYDLENDDLFNDDKLGIDILAHGLDDKTALQIESACIDLMGINNKIMPIISVKTPGNKNNTPASKFLALPKIPENKLPP